MKTIRLFSILMIICFIVIQGCKKNISEVSVPINAVVNAEWVNLPGDSGGFVNGTVTFTSDDGAMNITVNIGEQASLGETSHPQGEKFDIKIEASGALTRIYNQVFLKGNQVLNTTLLRLENFELAERIDVFNGAGGKGNENISWNQTTMKVSFNDTWEPIHEKYKKAIKEVIDEYVAFSPLVSSVEYEWNGTHERGDTIASGEIRVWAEIWTGGHAPIQNFVVVRNGAVEAGGLLTADVTRLSDNFLSYADDEFYDMMIDGNQNGHAIVYKDRYKLWMYHCALIWVEGRKNYYICLDYESETGYGGSY